MKDSKERYRLFHREHKSLLSARDNGEMWQNKGGPWFLWTRLDKTGVRRLSAIVDILVAGGAWFILDE